MPDIAPLIECYNWRLLGNVNNEVAACKILSVEDLMKPEDFIKEEVRLHPLSVLSPRDLKPRPPEKKITIVLDLDETMMKLDPQMRYVYVRPNLIKFLTRLNQKVIDLIGELTKDTPCENASQSLVEVLVWSSGEALHVDRCVRIIEAFVHQTISRGTWDPGKILDELTWDGTRSLESIVLIDNNKICSIHNPDSMLEVIDFDPFQHNEDGVFATLEDIFSSCCREALVEGQFNAALFQKLFLDQANESIPKNPQHLSDERIASYQKTHGWVARAEKISSEKIMSPWDLVIPPADPSDLASPPLPQYLTDSPDRLWSKTSRRSKRESMMPQEEIYLR